MLEVKIKRLHLDAKIPCYGHPGDAGLDLHSLEDIVVPVGGSHHFNVGFALEFPEGYVAEVKDKSSMAKAGLHAVGGIFDAGYRGEYNVLLVNLGDKPYSFEKGDKIAQLVICPVAYAKLVETDTLSESSRGEGRFGSTGRK
ncbi:MAG: dUTP diphosphatase [Candidatus Taylorbacteria bacterium]|nr:dUTP diphosphatase [Candidatus Taylorbacteria bacterium]